MFILIITYIIIGSQYIKSRGGMRAKRLAARLDGDRRWAGLERNQVGK
jgi:hypothetical protein